MQNSTKGHRESQAEADIMRSFSVPDVEKAVIVGTLLGDGHLNKKPQNRHYQLALTHGQPQEDYINMKVDALPSIFLAAPKVYNSPSMKYPTYRCDSICHPWLTELASILYRNRKRVITRKLLNFLTEDSLLFWVLDDGCLEKPNEAFRHYVICTDNFSRSDLLAIKKWFQQKWKLDPRLMATKGGKYLRLRFRKGDTTSLSKIMQTSRFFPLVPENMRYKFPKDTLDS